MHHHSILSILFILAMATFSCAQPAFLSSFPDLNALQLSEGNTLYYPASAQIEEVGNLGNSPSTVMRLEQGSAENPKTYVVRANLGTTPEQLHWTILYNSKNISHSIELNAHTLVLPGNDNLYSIETVQLDAPLALDTLELQHKYSLKGDVLVETQQPFYYIGVEATTSSFISLTSQPLGGERIAGVAADAPVTLLSLSLIEEGSYLLVASPFGLAGWLPVEISSSNTLHQSKLAKLLPAMANYPATKDIAVAAPAEISVADADMADTADAADAADTVDRTDTAIPPTSSETTVSTSPEASTDSALFTVDNATATRWLGLSQQIPADEAIFLDMRLDIDVAEVLLRGIKLEEKEIIGYINYAPDSPCLSALHYHGRTGKKLELEEVFITGQDICDSTGIIQLSAQEEGRILWRHYLEDGTLASDTILRRAPILNPEHSVARHWNEALLKAIRQDFARPTVHARNLFHMAVALYDAWAVFDDHAEPFLLGNTVGNFNCAFNGFDIPAEANKIALQEEAMSYAVYRLLEHRFGGDATTDANRNNRPFYGYLLALGYQPSTQSDYSQGSAAALGNYIGNCIIAFGLQDGANELGRYQNRRYIPRNECLMIGNVGIDELNPNFWQPLNFALMGTFTDQSGNPDDSKPAFLGAEWGYVTPFALDVTNRQELQRAGAPYYLYHDPGKPPYLGEDDAAYQWGFALVAAWSSHLDPADEVMIDISPASMGNLPVAEYPKTLEQYQAFYNIETGETPNYGYDLNPYTGQPYQPQIVRRGDYTRVLAEFWADGPDSETPPGHWFTVANYVSDHPAFVARFQGEGEVLSQLEWDVKTYFALGGAVHDAAISAWAVKGWYDYVRPLSAIRYMASQGQSSDPNLRNYAPNGIPLIKGLIEVIDEDDPLADDIPQNVGEIKLKAWQGQLFVQPRDVAGVDWLLASFWMPYQRSDFVTPPFAGYVSGHSTFSRAAAEVLSLITGDPFFPGGMGEFYAPKNKFLVFEDGPSEDIVLQWATYRDAADQTALSRIWGGIHPPADDIPGRLIGLQVGQEAFAKAVEYFNGTVDN